MGGVRIPVRATDFSLLQKAQIVSTAHPTSYSMDSGAISRRQCGQDVKLTILPHLVSRLRMSGFEYLLPPYAFME
jgi:hypothetical protein